jgi:hypothetical protein
MCVRNDRKGYPIVFSLSLMVIIEAKKGGMRIMPDEEGKHINFSSLSLFLCVGGKTSKANKTTKRENP